jgi:hypothetical protein
MSYSFSRDRTAELKDSFDQSNNSSRYFLFFKKIYLRVIFIFILNCSETTDHLSPRNITTQRSRPSSRYYNSQNEEEKEEERAYEMSERTVTSDMNTLDGFFEEVKESSRFCTIKISS